MRGVSDNNSSFNNRRAVNGQQDVAPATGGVARSRPVNGQQEVAPATTGGVARSRLVNGQQEVAPATGSVPGSRTVNGQQEVAPAISPSNLTLNQVPGTGNNAAHEPDAGLTQEQQDFNQHDDWVGTQWAAFNQFSRNFIEETAPQFTGGQGPDSDVDDFDSDDEEGAFVSTLQRTYEDDEAPVYRSFQQEGEEGSLNEQRMDPVSTWNAGLRPVLVRRQHAFGGGGGHSIISDLFGELPVES